MARIRITLVSFNLNHGLVAQRLHLPLRHLDPDKYEIRCVDLSDVRNSDLYYSDLVIISHPHGIESLHLVDRCRNHFNIPVVVDVDDLISDLPPDHPDILSFQQTYFTAILQSATYVVFSTPEFEAMCGHTNKNHTFIENSINDKLVRSAARKFKSYKTCFTVGWTGGQSHRSDQHYTFLDGLRQFLRNHDDVKAYFHILCPEILMKEFGSQIIFEKMPVDFLDYPAMAATYPMDVCLVGLTDNRFNNCKSDLKLLEMAPFDIGVIASPRADFIKHASRGIMLYAEDGVKDHPSWITQLEYAYEHQDRIAEMSKAAKEYVFTHRTSQRAADKWIKVIEEAIDLG